jgi:hypothetical protein
VQQELKKISALSALRVSAAAEYDLCRIVTLRTVEPGDFVIQEGDIGKAFHVWNSSTAHEPLLFSIQHLLTLDRAFFADYC